MIPAAIVGSVVGAGLGLISVGSWAMITFTGNLPIPLYEAARAVIRFQLRLGGYFVMLTSEYPWGLLGDLPTTGDEETARGSEWSIWLSQGGRNAMIVVIVLGVAAPTPIHATEAEAALRGRVIDERTAREAGKLAVANATPLSQNGYKVQLFQTAVYRTILLAAGQMAQFAEFLEPEQRFHVPQHRAARRIRHFH